MATWTAGRRGQKVKGRGAHVTRSLNQGEPAKVPEAEARWKWLPALGIAGVG